MKKVILFFLLLLSFIEGFSQINEKGFYSSLGCEIKAVKNGIASYMVTRIEGSKNYKFKMGLVRIDGEILTQPIYDEITLTDIGYVEVKQNGKWGALNKALKLVIPIKYSAVNYIERAAVFEVCLKNPQDGECRFGIVDLLGKEIIKPIYTKLTFINKNLAIASLNGKLGLINFNGVKIGEFVYEDLYHLYDDNGNFKKLIAAKLNGKWGIMDYTGKMLTSPKYDVLEIGREGLHGACLDGKCGYIDDAGKVVIDFKYEADIPYANASPRFYYFAQGMAKVKIDGYYGFLNRKGELAIDNVLTNTHGNHFYEEGLIWVDYRDSAILINKEGSILFKDKLDRQFKSFEVSYLGNGFSKVKKDGKWSLVNAKGERLFKYAFSSIWEPEPGDPIPVWWKSEGNSYAAYVDTLGNLQDKNVFFTTGFFHGQHATVNYRYTTFGPKEFIIDRSFNIIFPQLKKVDQNLNNKDRLCSGGVGQKVCLTSVDDNYNPFTLISQVEEVSNSSLCKAKILVTDIKSKTGTVVINGMEFRRNDSRWINSVDSYYNWQLCE